MRKRGIYFLTILSLIFAACSSNESDPAETNDDEPPQVVDKTQNLLSTGASANDILSNSNFDRLLIEATYAPGFRPTDEAMSNFQDYLRTHTFKTNIEVTYRELDATGEETLTLNEIDDLEQENRTAYNDGTTLAIYIFFADAPSDGDDLDEGLVTLGAVYRNTSMVIFESTVKTLAGRSLLITTEDVETATLNHEFGHLFGLVNLGTVPINNHEDSEAENHCNVDPCLMRAQLEFGPANKAIAVSHSKIHSSCSLNGNVLIEQMEFQVSRGNAATPELDAECRLDLENNGGRPSIDS